MAIKAAERARAAGGGGGGGCGCRGDGSQAQAPPAPAAAAAAVRPPEYIDLSYSDSGDKADVRGGGGAATSGGGGVGARRAASPAAAAAAVAFADFSLSRDSFSAERVKEEEEEREEGKEEPTRLVGCPFYLQQVCVVYFFFSFSLSPSFSFSLSFIAPFFFRVERGVFLRCGCNAREKNMPMGVRNDSVRVQKRALASFVVYVFHVWGSMRAGEGISPYSHALSYCTLFDAPPSCPLASQILAKSAQIVFLPYNYLLVRHGQGAQ